MICFAPTCFSNLRVLDLATTFLFTQPKRSYQGPVPTQYKGSYHLQTQAKAFLYCSFSALSP